jgi:hypothetical protein
MEAAISQIVPLQRLTVMAIGHCIKSVQLTWLQRWSTDDRRKIMIIIQRLLRVV